MKGMSRQGLRRLGYVIADTEELWMPGADGYLSDGTPYFTNKASAREWAAKERATTGRVIRIDPDGGLPGAEEVERELREKYRRQAESRRRRIERRRALSRGGRIPTSRKCP